jgi:hypothetical protein
MDNGRPFNTRLRFVRSKKIEEIIKYVNGLPYRIEIKGGIAHDGKKYFLSFILPDDISIREKTFGDLD